MKKAYRKMKKEYRKMKKESHEMKKGKNRREKKATSLLAYARDRLWINSTLLAYPYQLPHYEPTLKPLP